LGNNLDRHYREGEHDALRIFQMTHCPQLNSIMVYMGLVKPRSTRKPLLYLPFEKAFPPFTILPLCYPPFSSLTKEDAHGLENRRRKDHSG
jgi:hypothetical protein